MRKLIYEMKKLMEKLIDEDEEKLMENLTKRMKKWLLCL
jgi:hypothetical protein